MLPAEPIQQNTPILLIDSKICEISMAMKTVQVTQGDDYGLYTFHNDNLVSNKDSMKSKQRITRSGIWIKITIFYSLTFLSFEFLSFSQKHPLLAIACVTVEIPSMVLYLITILSHVPPHIQRHLIPVSLDSNLRFTRQFNVHIFFLLNSAIPILFSPSFLL